MQINLTSEQKKDAAFWVLIVSGVGCCVGGAFVPALIPVGASLLAGAIAIARDTSPSGVQNIQENQPHRVADNQSSSDEDINFGVHVDLTHHHRPRSRQSFEAVRQQPDVEDKKDDDHSAAKRHKRHP